MGADAESSNHRCNELRVDKVVTRLHRCVVEMNPMNTMEMEKQTAVGSTGLEAQTVIRWSALIFMVAYIAVSSYLIRDTRTRLAAATAAQNADFAKLHESQVATQEELKNSNQALAQQINVTERGLHAAYAGTSAELRQNQRVFEKRLQEQQTQAVDQVSSEVASVRTELNGAKSDIAAARTDLESTKVRLDRAIGDLTGQGTLIARTREDLEELRHRGDRNYYEFTLYKGERATQLSTIGLQLKKADSKKGKFTVNVIADDRVIEKKDRGVAEPLQFYTGRNRQLYEVVIFTVEKNKVTGYLSTPKTPSMAFGK